MVGRKLVFEIQLGLLIVSSSFSWYASAKGINVKPGFSDKYKSPRLQPETDEDR
jgi:hypothetical protein